jgi:hypothetical protein
MSCVQDGVVRGRPVNTQPVPGQNQLYRPATFQERGVVVPFTTPILAGVRVRRGGRDDCEWVVPNPSGGNGVYVVPSGGLRSLCHLTVHDSRLHQRVANLPALTPGAIRQAVLDVAAQGLAGRQAMEAAAAVTDRDREEVALTRYMLLGELAEQSAPKQFAFAGWRRERLPEAEKAAEQIAIRAAPLFQRSPEQVLGELVSLAAVFSGIGTAAQREPGRVLRLIGRLAGLREQLAFWMLEHCDDTHVELADTVAEAARQVIAAADPLLVAARAMTQDVAGLIRTWARAPARVGELASRPEWLLDGWEQICLLWQASDEPDQQWAVMAEMVQLVPVQPREIAEWGAGIGIPLRMNDSRISFNPQRRASVSLNLTARNERMRALVM